MNLAEIYPAGWPLLHVALCSPTEPHHHNESPCQHLGKVPLTTNWNGEAIARWGNGGDPMARLAETRRHLATGRNVGLALPLGVIVLDCDTSEATSIFEFAFGAESECPMQQTGRGGHFVFRQPQGTTIRARTRVEIMEGLAVDVRVGGRSQIVVEPSKHASGRPYCWKRSLPNRVEDLPLLPPMIVEALSSPATRTRGSPSPSANRTSGRDGKPIPAGQRNTRLASIAGSLRHRGLEQQQMLERLREINAERCVPPLDDREVRAIAASISRYEPAAMRGESRIEPGGAASECIEDEHLSDHGNALRPSAARTRTEDETAESVTRSRRVRTACVVAARSSPRASANSSAWASRTAARKPSVPLQANSDRTETPVSRAASSKLAPRATASTARRCLDVSSSDTARS